MTIQDITQKKLQALSTAFDSVNASLRQHASDPALVSKLVADLERLGKIEIAEREQSTREQHLAVTKEKLLLSKNKQSLAERKQKFLEEKYAEAKAAKAEKNKLKKSHRSPRHDPTFHHPFLDQIIPGWRQGIQPSDLDPGLHPAPAKPDPNHSHGHTPSSGNSTVQPHSEPAQPLPHLQPRTKTNSTLPLP